MGGEFLFVAEAPYRASVKSRRDSGRERKEEDDVPACFQRANRKEWV